MVCESNKKSYNLHNEYTAQDASLNATKKSVSMLYSGNKHLLSYIWF